MPQSKSRRSLSPVPLKSKSKSKSKSKTKTRLKFTSRYTSSDFNSDSDFDVNAEFDGDAYIARYEREQQEKIAAEAAERVEREYARIHGGIGGSSSTSASASSRIRTEEIDAGPSTSGSKAHMRSKPRDPKAEVEEVETKSRSRVYTSLEDLQAESSTSLISSTAGERPSKVCDRRHHLSGLMKSRERLKESMRRPGCRPRNGSGVWYETAHARGKGKGKEKERERTKEEVEMLEMKKVEDEFYEKIKGMNIPPPPSTAVEKREIIEPEIIPDSELKDVPNSADRADTLKDALCVDSDSEGGDETEEERVYLERYRDTNDPCRFCGKPLPLEYSREFTRLHARILYEISQDPNSIPFTDRMAYCSLHEKETTTIPLGRKRGYPRKIAWGEIWTEMEVGWIRRKVEAMVRDPRGSRMFRYHHCPSLSPRKEDEEWARSCERLNPSDRISVGYYGDIGREIIKAYVLELAEWKYLPLYKHPTRYKPLGPKQFIQHILVPEIAVMLIVRRLRLRLRQQASNSSPPTNDGIGGDITEEEYILGQKVRRESIAYGRVAYGDMDSELGSGIILAWSKGQKRRKGELEVSRPRKVKVKPRAKENGKDKDKVGGTHKPEVGMQKRAGKSTGKEVVDLTEEPGDQGSQADGIGKDEAEVLDLTDDVKDSDNDDDNDDSDVELVPASPPLGVNARERQQRSGSSTVSPPCRPFSSPANQPSKSDHRTSPPSTSPRKSSKIRTSSSIRSESEASDSHSISHQESGDEIVVLKPLPKLGTKDQQKKKRGHQLPSSSSPGPPSSQKRSRYSHNPSPKPKPKPSSTDRMKLTPTTIKGRKSVSLSQDSFAELDFDIPSQDLERLDAIMA